MARLLPSKPDPDAPPSEKRIFELFANSLPHTTTVLHGRRLVLTADGTHTQKTCDIAFLLLRTIFFAGGRIFALHDTPLSE